MIALMKAVNNPNFGTLPDFGNFPKGGDGKYTIDIYDAIERMMPYAKGVSAKSYDFDDEGQRDDARLSPDHEDRDRRPATTASSASSTRGAASASPRGSRRPRSCSSRSGVADVRPPSRHSSCSGVRNSVERDLKSLESEASSKVLWPILGLLAGLLLGGLRAWISGAGDLSLLALVIAGGIVGSGFGMAAVFATAYPVRAIRITSLRVLMVLVLLVALLLWWLLRSLAELLIQSV